jgi:hypothetical protein
LAEEPAKWPLLNKVIRASKEEAAAAAPPGPEYLPAPPQAANVWPPPQVFIDLHDED